MPDVYHVSWNVTSVCGTKQRRNVPSSHDAPPSTHWQCWVPLPHAQRPVTSNPATPLRRVATPCPFGANTPPVIDVRSP